MAEDANHLRRAARARAARERRWTPVAWAALGAIPVLAVALILLARRRDRVEGVPPVLEEPPYPDEAPAVLAHAWAAAHRRDGGRAAFRAQLLDLVDDRVIEIIPAGTVSESRDYELHLRDTPGDGLGRAFVAYLFGDTEPGPGVRPVTLRSLRGTGSRKDLIAWWDAVKARNGRLLQGSGRRPETATFGYLFLLSPGWGIVLTMLSRFAGAGYTLAAVGTSLAALIVAHRLVPRRVLAGRREWLARWTAFRRYLKRFSTLTDAPTSGVVVWERYLVLAVALRCAKRVHKQVRAVVPEDQLAVWTASASMLSPELFRTIQTVGVPSPSTPVWSGSGGSSSSSSDWSSSIGSGGGFSSGGGGGGGGTGGGAG